MISNKPEIVDFSMGNYKHLITSNHPDAYLRFTLKLKFCDARVVKYQKQSSRRRRVLALWPPVASDTVASVTPPTYTSPPHPSLLPLFLLLLLFVFLQSIPWTLKIVLSKCFSRLSPSSFHLLNILYFTRHTL